MTKEEFLTKLDALRYDLDGTVTQLQTLYDEFATTDMILHLHGIGEIGNAVSMFEDANNDLHAAYDYATDAPE